MKRLLIVPAIVLSAMAMSGCSSSEGEKAAKEVIQYYRKGDFERVQDAIMKYGVELKGQDLLDFSEELEKEGIL